MYSQNAEEKFILEYFGNFVGHLLDIGANDGRTLSNSLALIEKGWGGTLVEASPEAYQRLTDEHARRPLLQLMNIAVGSYDGEIEFHESGELLGQGDIALVSSTREDERQRWTSLKMPFKKMMVPVTSFTSLTHDLDYQTYEFLTIDIEGMEVEVVPQIDFTDLGVRMAIIEWNGKNAELYDTHLLKHGLKLIHVNAENRIYAK